MTGMGYNADNFGEQCAGGLLVLIPRKVFLGPLECLVRLHGGSIEFQSCDFPHCYVSLKELLTHTDLQ